MTEPVSLAIVGAGIIGRRHGSLALAEPACKLVATVEPDPASAAKAAAELGVPNYPDIPSLLANESVEGVVVATPNFAHVPVGIECAERGLHMLMEKPVADTLEAGGKLMAAVKKADVRMAVGHHRRFDPEAEVAREIIQSGEIGRVLAINMLWVQRKPDSYFADEWRRLPGAGPTMMNLIHDVDMLRYVYGEIESVYAETTNSARGFVIEDTAAAIMRFVDGALCNITVSDALPSPWTWESATGENPVVPLTGESCYRFFGTHGVLEFPQIEIWRHDGASPGAWNLPFIREKRAISERAALAGQIKQFCAVVRGTEEPRLDGPGGLMTLAATLAVHESARQGKPIVVRDLL